MIGSFTMKCKRKHLIRDTIELLSIHNSGIMTIGQADKPPKYNFQINLDLKFHWQLQNNTIQQFGIQFGAAIKWFFAEDPDIKNLIKLLGNRVIYQNVGDFFEQRGSLGSGSTSEVVLVKEKFTGHTFASKCIKKQSLMNENDRESLLQEISIMQKLSHPKIIELHRLFDGNDNFYLILEYLEGKNLNSLISNKNFQLDYNDIKIIMKQLLEGLTYIHSQGFMHRDIKPENIVFKNQDINTLKIVDFGLALNCNLPKFPYPKCGTPGYVAPEIALLKDSNQIYSNKCDVFSSGVIMFRMFTQMDVFPGKDLDEIYLRNKQVRIDLSPMEKMNLPEVFKDLIRKMLQINPNQRISAKDALNHGFFSSNHKKSNNISTTTIKNENDSTLNLSNNSCISKTIQSKQFEKLLNQMEEEDEYIQIE